MATKPMLWNKARRDLHAIARERTPASNHRQVEPGLRWKPLQSAFRNLQSPLVGHVTHGIQADALEQSEAAFKDLASVVLVDEEPSPGGTWPTN